MRSKPSNMKYTDLCIYIDSVLYYRDENNNPTGQRKLSEKEIDNVYTYLYHLTYALAVKKRLFTNKADYENFCLEAAAKFFHRLTRPDQDSNSRSKKYIKSVLNYVKGAIGFMAITYRQENYAQILNPEHDSLEDLQGARVWMETQVNNQYSIDLQHDIVEIFKLLPQYIDQVCDDSVYKNNKYVKNNFKLSLEVSLLNALSLSGKYDNKTESRRQSLVMKQLQERSESNIVWNNFKDITPGMVELGIKKVFRLIEQDLNDVKQAYTLDDNIMEDIIKSALPTYGLNQSED